jgi:hypothetical protein
MVKEECEIILRGANPAHGGRIPRSGPPMPSIAEMERGKESGMI